MSLKRNITVNYISQLYVTGIGILILPLYIQYMGAEAYGLVGFFTMLQACFVLLDIGLTPTISREAARFKGGVVSVLAYRQLFRALSLIFALIALLGGVSLFFVAETIAVRWLKVDQLELGGVVLAVQIMVVSVALRWMGGLYRGVITGAEHLQWLGGFNVLIASLRFLGVFASMHFFGFTPVVFFVHQLGVVVLEVLMLFIKCSRLLPSKSNINAVIGWSLKPVRPMLKFTLTIAFTSAVWVLVTQTDKLVLSGILPLADYGLFSLAVLAASGIIVISGPISSAIMPRMARLHSEGKGEELIRIYCNATEFVSVVAGSAAITIAFCAKQILIAWTGDLTVSEQAAPILRLYAIGNLFLCTAAFSYYLQYARGDLRYHLVGNVVLLIVLVPSVVLAAINFGGAGAGFAWLIMNAIYLFCWVAFVHWKLEPGLHLKWIARNVLKIELPIIVVAMLLEPYVYTEERLGSLLAVLCFFSALILVAMLASMASISRFKRFFQGMIF